jgi:hypothetical protein
VWKTSCEKEDRDDAKDRMAVRSERWCSVTRLLNEAWNGILYYMSDERKTKTKGRENYLQSWWTNEEACNSKQPNRVKFCFLGNGPIMTQHPASHLTNYRYRMICAEGNNPLRLKD